MTRVWLRCGCDEPATIQYNGVYYCARCYRVHLDNETRREHAEDDARDADDSELRDYYGDGSD